ncbi:WD40 repeat domain-containing protein [Pseudonocardia humida]|uniref:WD40 repeat domain-containing protein n=1 Tax=Pseudonocardia humida TaxID=2800819 RepID=A0ABT1ADF0_9PSEU|nr:WD40 repeat domain-containing protein [Pseudonocardia humida]MCO1660834.1 WD40 repeat domain-containing protein [Pseudonocardia humida]MCO1661028.1 WD40 repeat domain-containing protein [Pseudonocardia humida]
MSSPEPGFDRHDLQRGRSTSGQFIFPDSFGWIMCWTPLTFPDGRPVVVTGGSDGTLRMWDPATGAQVAPPIAAGCIADGGAMGVTGVRVVDSSDGPRVAVTSGNGQGDRGPVRLWDPLSGEMNGELDEDEPASPADARPGADAPPFLPQRPTGEVAFLAVRPGTASVPATVVTAVNGPTGVRDRSGLRIWDPVAGTRIGVLDLAGETQRLAYVPRTGGPDLLVGFDHHPARVQVWDAMTGTPLADPTATHPLVTKQVCHLRVADGRTLIAMRGAPAAGSGTSRTDVVRLWDPDTGANLPAPFDCVPMTIAAVPGPTGGDLVACLSGMDDTVEVFDPVTGARFGTPFEPDDTRYVELIGLRGPAGRPLVAVVSDSGPDLPVWDVTSGELVNELVDVWVANWAVIPRPDGTDALAIAGQSGDVGIWDPGTGEQVIGPLLGHGTHSGADVFHHVHIAVLADGDGRQSLITGGVDNTLRRWQLPDFASPA